MRGRLRSTTKIFPGIFEYMKPLLWAFVLLLLFGLSPIPAHAQGEQILDYDTSITVNTDGTFDVHEGIRYDFDDLARHGIYRDIPYIKKNAGGKRFLLEITDVDVSEQFVQQKQGDLLRLKIGDPEVTVTGIQTYAIAYTVGGGLTYFSDHDELYWNAVGDQWQVPVQAAAVTVTLPSDIPTGEIRVACFTGTFGSTDADCTGGVVDGRNIEIVADRPLDSYEGLTIVVGFPKGVVAQREPEQVDAYKETWWWKTLVFLFLCVLVLITTAWYIIAPFFIMYRWLKYGRDPRPPMGEARAWFSPPTGAGGRPLTPGETGTIIDERAGMHEIVATIIDLARRGYLTIEERTRGDFYLHKKNDSTAELRQHEKTLMREVFDHTRVVHVAKASWVKTVATMKKQLYEAVVGERFFTQNPETQRAKYYVLGVLALGTANIPLALASFIFGTGMPKKTSEGAQAAAMARSLRNFLTSQEKKLKFQAKNNMLFEKLLPFATAFGVEAIWAARFAHLRMSPPGWYEGDATARFNTYTFTRAFHASFASSVAHAATPTSSSSGFSSGFSGGSSGGGGGGGGGGSW